MRDETYLEVLLHPLGVRALGYNGRPALHAPAERNLCRRRVVRCHHALEVRVLEEQWVGRTCGSWIDDQDCDSDFHDVIGLPKGEYAVSKIPLASQYALSSVSGRQGCSCTWFVTGMTLQCGRRISRFLIEKLDMPMLLTLPMCVLRESEYCE